MTFALPGALHIRNPQSLTVQRPREDLPAVVRRFVRWLFTHISVVRCQVCAACCPIVDCLDGQLSIHSP